MQSLIHRYGALLRQIFYTLLGLCSYFVMQPAFASDLKVLSINLNAEVMRDDSDFKIRERRFTAMVNWIQENSPDVILVQNGWSYHKFKSVAIPLASATGYDYTYRVTSGGPVKGYKSNFILAKKKFMLDQQKVMKLPHSPITAEPSFAVGARLRLEDGKTAYTYTARFLGKTDAERTDQFAVIDKAMQDHAISNYEYPAEARMIIAGDLGSTPDSLSMYEISRRGYFDSFKKAHPGKDALKACTQCSDPLTQEFNPLSLTTDKNRRTDYIFTRGTTLQIRGSTLVFARPISGMWLSHHNGVLTTFTTENPPGTVVGSVPNPIYDKNPTPHLTQILRLNDFNLKGTQSVSDSEVSTEKGITFVNDTKSPVRIRLTGSGEIYSKESKVIGPKKSASFFFEPSQKYNFTAKKVGTLKKLQGTLLTNIE